MEVSFVCFIYLRLRLLLVLLYVFTPSVMFIEIVFASSSTLCVCSLRHVHWDCVCFWFYSVCLLPPSCSLRLCLLLVLLCVFTPSVMFIEIVYLHSGLFIYLSVCLLLPCLVHWLVIVFTYAPSCSLTWDYVYFFLPCSVHWLKILFTSTVSCSLTCPVCWLEIVFTSVF